MRRLLVPTTFAGLVFLACSSTPAPVPPPVAPVVAPPVVAAAPSTPALKIEETGIVPAWMDKSVDPCQDYFAYACGGFVKNTAIPSDEARWSVSEIIEKGNEEFLRDVLEKAAAGALSDPTSKKIGDYYAACMDEDGAEKLGLSSIAPLLADVAKVKDAKSLAAAIIALHSVGIFPLFDIGAQQDFKDATFVIAALDQDGIGLPDRDYYLKDDASLKEMRTFYAAHVGRTFALAGVKGGDVKAAVADVMRIETKIAKLQQDKVVRRDPYAVYHPLDRKGLAAVSTTFPWDDYFKALGIADAHALSINDPAYFKGIDALMHQEKPAAWRHYLTWEVLSAESPHLTRAFVDERFAMRQKLTGQKELEPRWKRCVRNVDGALGELLAQPYVAAKLPREGKARAKALVDMIHTAMGTELQSLPWMDEPTRTAAITKLGKMTDKVGYPDKWRSYEFEVTRASWAANALAAERFEMHRNLLKVGKPVDRAEWDMTPPTVNAYYNPSLNEIVLPAGELQPPFFFRDFYAPVNIGDEGANTIGHEITHAFDDEGAKFDGDGNLRDWWTKDTQAKFDASTKCVQDQYSQYEAVPGVKLNGELTSGENIADIGGVKLGYAALTAWKAAHPEEHRQVDGYTDEQIYFLAYAQGWCSKETPEILETMARTNPHSPPRFRVNGPMADVPAFATAYQCKVGQAMDPGKVCAVW